jgi:hypothetical protein
LRTPNVPDETGLILVSYGRVTEASHRCGRVLLHLGNGDLIDAVVRDVSQEITAVDHAGLGEVSGRAAQATVLDRTDTSPVQVAAADAAFAKDPLGDPGLFTAFDPASACVAAAHWLTAAAVVAGDASELLPAQVFAEADTINAFSVEVPEFVVAAIDEEELPPGTVITELLADAALAKDGRIPDTDALVERIAEAENRAAAYPDHVRDEARQCASVRRGARRARRYRSRSG